MNVARGLGREVGTLIGVGESDEYRLVLRSVGSREEHLHTELELVWALRLPR